MFFVWLFWFCGFVVGFFSPVVFVVVVLAFFFTT